METILSRTAKDGAIKMKIAFCTNYYPPHMGGAEIVSEAIVSELTKDNDVYVFTRTVAGRRKTKDSSTSATIIDYNNINDQAFLAKLSSIKPDLIFVYSDLFDFYRSLLTTEIKAKLVVATCGCNWAFSNENKQRLFETAHKKIDRIVCHSKHERDYKLCQRLDILDKVEIIPNGVYLEEFKEKQSGRYHLVDLPEMQKKTWILNVANFFPFKGQNQMVSIVDELSKRREDIYYVQIASQQCPGIGPRLQKEWLQQVSTRLDKRKVTTRLVETNERKEVIGWFQNSDVYVCTSLKEVAPITHLEAMAAGIPWVSTNVGNIPDLSGGSIIDNVRDRNYHFVFDRQTILKIVDAIEFQIAKKENGQKQIQTELNWEIILPKYTELITDVLDA